MAKSELAKAMQEFIKSADKLASDIREDTAKLIDAARKLKEIGRDEKGR